MRFHPLLSAVFAITPTITWAQQYADSTSNPTVPSLCVPACPSKATASWSTAMPSPTAFPRTHVSLCYTPRTLNFTFTALDETSFFTNESYKTNDPIYNYEVMEAFIYRGTNTPTTYMEFEVSPRNVTWHSWIYNPSKIRAPGAPFTNAFITDPRLSGIEARTTLNRKEKTWVSEVGISLAHFSVDEPRGEKWRMNFFRTVVDPKTFPNQTLGAWSPNGQPSFHNSLYFGQIEFV